MLVLFLIATPPLAASSLKPLSVIDPTRRGIGSNRHLTLNIDALSGPFLTRMNPGDLERQIRQAGLLFSLIA